MMILSSPFPVHDMTGFARSATVTIWTRLYKGGAVNTFMREAMKSKKKSSANTNSETDPLDSQHYLIRVANARGALVKNESRCDQD